MSRMSLKGLNFETFFREADVNNDGHLSLQELIVTLRKYGYKNRDDEIRVSERASRACSTSTNKLSRTQGTQVKSKQRKVLLRGSCRT